MKYIPSLLIYSTFLALCYFGVTEFENAKSLFLSQMTLNMIICGFFLLGLFLEIRTLSILSQAETWFEDPKANKTPKILGHIKSYLEPYLSEAKTQKSKYTLNFSDFQSIQIYLFTQFSMKNRNTQSISWSLMIFSLIGSMFLLVMHIPTYISQSASPVDFLNAETYVTILPLILSQFDDIFFPLLLGAGLALTLSLHLQWTQMQQIKLIDKISEKLAGFLKAIEVQTATEIKTEDPEKLATLQTEMQNHVENLRSQLSSLTEEAKLENDSAILKAEKTDDPQPN